MSMRMQLHGVGTFPVCPHCGDELRHIVDYSTTGGHLLSCCCGDSPKFPTFEALLTAMRGWCRMHAVAVPAGVSLPLLAPPQARPPAHQVVRA